jgi:YtkA-like
MRIRPVFWCMLAFVCCAVLIFAGTIREHASAVMQVRVDKTVPVSVGYTAVDLHLSDPQNIPIEQAQVIPTATMTNMDMTAISTAVKALGQGNYSVQFALSMAGPWKITIIAHADGFDALQQSLLVQVAPPVTMGAGVTASLQWQYPL